MGQTGRVFLHAGIWLGLGLLIYVFFLRQENPPPRLLGPSSVELQRTPDGHFYIDGRILSEPIRFLIDTGASTVSISERLARQAGLGCDRVSTFTTANGTVQGCTTRVAQLFFGPFEIRDVGVVILPKLGGDALLGMNVLRRVRMEQAGDRLRLSAQ
jgi:aspartyl protease family protein